MSKEIPELTDTIDLEHDLPELTEVVKAVDSIPELTDAIVSPANIPTLTEVAPADQEEPSVEHLEQQQAELEAQANLELNSDNTPSATDQALVMRAAYQRLEALIMDQMPPQLAGSFLSILERNIQANEKLILEELTLLGEDDLLDLLEQLDPDAGF